MFSRAHSELLAMLGCVASLFLSSEAGAQRAAATGAGGGASGAAAPEDAESAPDSVDDSTPAAEAEAAPSTSTTPEDEESAEAEAAPTTPTPRPAAAFRMANTRTDARVDGDEEKDEQSSCGSGSIALSSGGCTKPWRVIGYAEYRQLAVTDDDPAAGRSLRMFAQGSYRIAKKHNVSVWGRIRYLQNFVAEKGESAARFQDPVLGLDYTQQLSSAEPTRKWANFFLQHRVTGTIPAQRETRANDLRTRLGALERVRFIPIPEVYIGPDLTAGYNVHKYAEQAGQQGTVNEQADFSGTMVAEWYPWQSEKYGSVLIGADSGIGYTLNHRGRGGDLAQQEQRWSQNYSWDLYGYYMPVPQLWLGAALSHSAAVMRDGTNVIDFTNRDSTLLSLSCTALY